MNLRDEFDLDPSLIYLNSGSHSICPRQVLDAVVHHQREYERNPTINLFNAYNRLWEAQSVVAKFFGADPHDIFLRANVTLAMNTFVLGVSLNPGSEILISDLEYGAIDTLARFRSERDGLKLRRFHLPGPVSEISNLTEDALYEQVISAIKPETSLLILSHVMTGSGLILPIARIAQETRRRGILLAIDGAHAPGYLPLDFTQLGDVDFYGSNLHKWMLGPKGTGFGWVPKRIQDRVKPIEAGWTTFETPPIFASFGGQSQFQSQMLMKGCHDFAPYFALKEVCAFWDRLGWKNITARIYDLQNHVDKTMATCAGWQLAAPPANSGLRGPLLSFTIPKHVQSKADQLLVNLLHNHGLQVHVTQVQNEWRLRLSPHIYNTEAEIERAAEILKNLP